jgi:hypothetical protein
MTTIFELICYLNIASISAPCRVRHTRHGAHGVYVLQGAPYMSFALTALSDDLITAGQISYRCEAAPHMNQTGERK